MEVYRGKLVLYGCGDLINDYEGITGHEEFRSDLRLLYFAAFDQATTTLAHLRIVPMRSRRMRLRSASCADGEWLRDVLERAAGHFGSRFELEPDGELVLRC
jgi:poly-gamma-glutamate synthesis protein (capsule biosynthesis protein)